MHESNHPPRFPAWLLERFLLPEERADVMGDLEEQFSLEVNENGRVRASLHYYADFLAALPAFIARSISWSIIMLANHFKTAVRNFLRHKSYSVINVSGLALGLACALLIVLWMKDEMSYDRFHSDGAEIQRVVRNTHKSDGGITTSNSVPKPLASVLAEEYPEIDHTVLVGWEQTMVISRGDDVGRSLGRYAGPDLFKVFPFPFIVGDPEAALDDPDSIVLSETLARRYFGPDWRETRDVLGSTLRLDNRVDLVITGVFEDIPANSSLRFNFVVQIEDFISRNDWVEHWGNNGLAMYLRLRPGADQAAVSSKIANVIRDHDDDSDESLFLQPLHDVYLHSNFEDGIAAGGRIEYLRVFSMIALFIVLIACINFMNLATARSAHRAREVGVRKAVGASRSSIASQFFGESVATVAVASLVAVALAAFLLPGFNELTGKSIALGEVGILTWLAFGAAALGTGLLAGAYPALYLSAFHVVGVLRGGSSKLAGRAGIRKGLVVFQFVLSIALLVGTVTVANQIDYIQSKNMGLERENLLFVDLEGGIRDQYDAFRQEMLQLPEIADVARASQNPMDVGQSTSGPMWAGKDPLDNTEFQVIRTGYDFVDVAGIKLLEGRVYSRDFESEQTSFLVNQEAARRMGMNQPVGQGLSLWGRDGSIVGVVADFHTSSFYDDIQPLIFVFAPATTNRVFIRTAAGKTPEAIRSLERIYARFNPEFPLLYRFLDDEFQEMYRTEMVIGRLATYFAFLAIFISCLGLLGLVSFTAEQRTKEIGVRKVLGASVANIVLLLSMDFVKLVILAFVLAAPISYIAMNDWLEGFAYHADIGIGTLLLAGTGAVLIAGLTVGYQSIRAGRADPTKSLRAE